MSIGRASHALAAYIVLTLVYTWPLAAGLGRDVAWDLGDSVLNMWILAWDCEQILAILGGDFSRATTFFNANIFHPAPLPLAYSDHLFAQAVQVLPVYAVSRNPILSYNLLFLSTFVLSGLGMYLLVRELTGNGKAAFVAGLVFAFMPYRLPQSSHLQVLSSQWMPFTLYALRRYFDTRRLRPLAGAVLALAAQNLSSGYYLLYFSPFAAAYAAWEIWRRALWRDRRMWAQLAVAGALVVVVTAPFLVPYARVRAELDAVRAISEVSRFSADVYSYATAFNEHWLWGARMRAFPKPEGDLFPGFVTLALALIGIAAGHIGGDANRPHAAGRVPRWLVTLLAIVAITHLIAAFATLIERRITLDVGIFVLRISNVSQLLLRATVALVILFAVSPAARGSAAAFLRDRGYFVLGLVAAIWLSLGPTPQSLGRPLEIAAPYALLYEFVPGFEGLRVPARFAMVAMLMLAALAGYGADVIGRRRRGALVLLSIAIVFLIETFNGSFLINGMTPLRDYVTPEARLYRPQRAPAVYREVARLAPDAILVELPLGQPDYDLRAMYYSLAHWRQLLNGYSGFFPPHYVQLRFALNELPRHPETSLQVLQAGGATHAIVHEGAFLGAEGPATSAALRGLGAVELFRDGADVLLVLPPPQPQVAFLP